MIRTTASTTSIATETALGVFGSCSGAWRPVQIIDTLGREIDFIYGDSRWSFVTEIRVQNHQGQNLTFGVQYQTITADLRP